MLNPVDPARFSKAFNRTTQKGRLMKLLPLSPNSHQHHVWQKPKDWSYLRPQTLYTVQAMDMPRLCTTYPLAFQATQAGHYQPIALLGLQPDFNLYIARDGRWLTPVVPHQVQTAPFAIATTEHHTQVLCIDDNAQALSENTDQGQPLFDDQGQSHDSLKPIIQQLQAHQANQINTQKACDHLNRLELIQPWNAQVATQQGSIILQGLYTLDEAKLNRLNAQDLKALQDSGALGMAYCQLISTQHLSYLGKLADAHANLDKKYAEKPSLDLEDYFSDNDDLFKF